MPTKHSCVAILLAFLSFILIAAGCARAPVSSPSVAPVTPYDKSISRDFERQLQPSESVSSASFLAFSMREAEQRIKKQGRSNVATEVIEIGEITRLAGMAYDPENDDLIIIGQVIKETPKITLDEFVAAMRTIFLDSVWPRVSIDKTPDTQKTGRQKVNFRGNITNTEFGSNLLEADIVLKKLALGLLSTHALGTDTYFTMSVEHSERNEADEEIGSRFWFYPREEKSLTVLENVSAINKLPVGVDVEVLSARVDGSPVSDLSEFRDQVGEDFAKALESEYDDVSRQYPEIARIKNLFDLVVLSVGIKCLSGGSLSSGLDLDIKCPPSGSLLSENNLRFWLHEYRIPYVETPKDYPLLKREEEVRTTGRVRVLEIDGGIELGPIMLRLRDGDVTALQEVVIKSRPS